MSKFSPASIIIPDTIPSTKVEHNDRIDLVQSSLSSFCLENATVSNSKIYNPSINSMFCISKNLVGSAFFVRDGIHLSHIGTNILTSFLAGIIRSLHSLTDTDRTELAAFKQARINPIPRPNYVSGASLRPRPSYVPGAGYNNNQHNGYQNNRLSHYNRFAKNQNNPQRGNDS